MSYSRTTWEEGITPLSPENMNNIEDGIEECKTALENVYTKEEVIPKSEQYGSSFGSTVTIPRTLSNSNKTATFNYTFPADGYLHISTVAANMTNMQSWGLTLNHAPGVPFVFASPFTQNITLFVKKGMTLNGSVQFSSAAELAKVVTQFYPFQLLT